jgi:Tfp pilus assembly protein PilF
MRKLVYLIVIVLFTKAAFAQTTSPMKSFSSLKSDLEKQQQAVLEPKEADFADAKKYAKAKEKYDKKVANPSTWLSLGDAYKDVYVYAGEEIGYGAPMQSTMFIKGTPKEKATLENKEIWTYDDFKLYFTDGKVTKWELNEEVPDAVKNSINAYEQAIKLDTKGSIKKKAVEELVFLRNFLRGEGIMYYFDEQLDKAITDYKYSSQIYELEDMKSADTTNYNISEIYYYGAAFSEANKDLQTAIYFYNKNIEYCKTVPVAQQSEIIKTYRYLANDYKALGDTAKQEQTLMDAYALYPEDKDILVDITQYYLDLGIAKKALEFLDMALEKEPTNYLYIFVRGTLYDGFKTKIYDKMDKIRIEVYNADTARQEGKITRADFNTLRDKKIKEANALWPDADVQMNKATDEYNKALAIQPDYFNAKFNLGAILYNKGAQIIKMADLIPTSDMKAYDAETAKAKVIFEKALPFLEEAVVIEPDNFSVLQTLSTVYAKLGQYDKVKEMKAKIEEVNAKQTTNGIK